MEENPFKNIERVILVVLAVWVIAIIGWFVSNLQITPKEKLVAATEIFLEENEVVATSINCTVDAGEESGNCNIVDNNQRNLVVSCPINSALFDFAGVFFVKGEPCIFVE